VSNKYLKRALGREARRFSLGTLTCVFVHEKHSVLLGQRAQKLLGHLLLVLEETHLHHWRCT
jgi:hypothetical protein